MGDYNLRITDIDWTEGNKYEANTGFIYVVKGSYLVRDTTGRYMDEEYPLEGIAKLTFKKVIDWTKVPVDTKILARDSVLNEWIKMHFAKYGDEGVFAFIDGKTSYTANGEYRLWAYTKLAEEEEEE